ncbi:SH3 domain-containing protein [Aquimarina litoralis]|uniref:SH3 domain-containing protein n=1 Tax=Aquimarina litoralis TaxID=584605 RepID=UPI001C559BA0|nr:SH3 domain-containing protein [Aquimarina litoralis]
MKRGILFLIIICFGDLYGQDYLFIEGKDIWIRETPINGEVIMKLNTGDKCIILKKGSPQTIKGCYDYWYKINYNDETGWVFGSQTSIKTDESMHNLNFTAQLKEFLNLLKTNSKQIQKYIHPQYKLRYIDEGHGIYTDISLHHSFDSLIKQKEYFRKYIDDFSKANKIPIQYYDGEIETFSPMNAYVNTEKITFSQCSYSAKIILRHQHEIDIDSEEFKKTEEYKELRATINLEKQIKKKVNINDYGFFFFLEGFKWYLGVIDSVSGL